MALLFLDSFDHYATADVTEKWTQIINGAAASGGNPQIGAWGRRSSQGLRMIASNSGGTNTPAIVLPATGPTFICGFSFSQNYEFAGLKASTPPSGFNLAGAMNSAGQSNMMVGMRLDGVVQCWMRVNLNGTISVYNQQSSAAALGTTTNALQVGVTYYVELKVLIDNTVGTVDVQVDGINWLSVSAADTQNSVASTWNELVFARNGSTTGNIGETWTMDDLYVADGSGTGGWTDFKGDTRVDAVFPNANGTLREWAPSTGTDDFAVVDETAPTDDADYLEETVPGERVSMNFTNTALPAGAVVHGVQLVCHGRKTDAGSAGHKGLARVSGANYLGPQQALTSSYSYVRTLWDKNPNTDAIWTEAEVNASEFGAQKTS